MSERLNLLAPEVLANPYPHYAELRRNAPVTQVGPSGLSAAGPVEWKRSLTMRGVQSLPLVVHPA